MAKWLKKYGLWALPLWLICRLCHRWAQGAIGFELPLQVEVGSGFVVYHGWALVINDKVKIGKNVTLLHSVTLGAIGDKVPVIEDDVFIGVGAIILGGVCVGKGARIGAGALILKDVEPYSVVVGNPQKVLRRGSNGL